MILNTVSQSAYWEKYKKELEIETCLYDPQSNSNLRGYML